MQWDSYQHRNNVLYDRFLVEIMEDRLSLHISIRIEWRLGSIEFPDIVKETLLPKGISGVINGTVAEKKGGLFQ